MTRPHATQQTAVHVDPSGPSLVVRAFSLTDDVAVRKARHWTTGRRGPAIEDPAALARADLTAYLTEAVVLGSRALSAMGQSGEARSSSRCCARSARRRPAPPGKPPGKPPGLPGGRCPMP